MALTEFQRDILCLLAPSRLDRESYVAGGVALNTQLAAARLSADVDLFHDTVEAVARTVTADSVLLESQGYSVRFLRQLPSFAEALVERDGSSTLMQWVFDSAYRFFPLVTHDELGLTLHPFDLATNKALAMAGRLEVRDFIDLISCCESLQPLGYLVWAACGKDPGFGPPALLQEIRRGSRYSQEEIDLLDFAGPRPDAADLGRRWRAQIEQAEALCELLPPDEVGTAVLDTRGNLCRLGPAELQSALDENSIRWHRGRIGGAWPSFRR
jgi:hypothetical protein